MTIVLFCCGVIVGVGISLLFIWLRSKDQAQFKESLKQTFSALSHETMNKNTDTFLKLAQDRLAQERELNTKDLTHNKTLIEQTLTQMKSELDKVQTTVTQLEKDREKKFGELNQYLKMNTQQTTQLMETTQQLKEALANSKTRGQWGERMADDILRISGLIEGVNYTKQKSMDSNRNIPDFTFYLPNQLKVNMDVKFPLQNYLQYLNQSSDIERDQYKQRFFRDVKHQIKEIQTKSYINTEENTVDYALIFIPNEQIYQFIFDHDPNLIDDTLKNKIIFCSPLSLYALLAVIRQAIDNFAMEQTTTEILSIMGTFYKQWQKFNDGLEKMGRRIYDTQTEFEALITTRKNQLEKPLDRIESIREEKKIELIEH